MTLDDSCFPALVAVMTVRFCWCRGRDGPSLYLLRLVTTVMLKDRVKKRKMNSHMYHYLHLFHLSLTLSLDLCKPAISNTLSVAAKVPATVFAFVTPAACRSPPNLADAAAPVTATAENVARLPAFVAISD